MKALAFVFVVLSFLFLFCLTARAAVVTLPLPDSRQVLTYSCGGQYVSSYVTDFDGQTIHGSVRVQTSCSTGGRGTKPKLYTAWRTLTWSLAGELTSVETYDGLEPDPTYTEEISGYRVYDQVVAQWRGRPLYRATLTTP